jgi:branched-chain amino acid transport system permease protein
VAHVIVFLLLGVGSGALIAGTGLGVVLSYRGAGVINLAAGAIAMMCGYCYTTLKTGFFGPTLPTAWAVVVTIGFAVAVAVAFELLVVIPLRDATPLAKLVASLGFLISAMAAVSIVVSPGPVQQPSLFTDNLFQLWGLSLLWNRFEIAGVIGVLAIVLIFLYRFTRFGLATRAASEHELHATLVGLSPRWLSLANTALMAIVMATVGLMAGTIQVLDPTDLSLLIVSGLAAALFGRLSSLTVTLIAGLLIGMVTSLLVWCSTLSWFPSESAIHAPLPGIQELLTFLILVLAVSLRGGRIPSRGEVLERRLPSAPLARHPARSALIYGGAAAVALWAFPAAYRQSFISSLIDVVLLFSIVLITGFVGQVSVAQLALGGIAGYGMASATMRWGFGIPLAPILGVLAATVVGFLLAIPALRVRGVSLVIVTLAAAVAIEDFVLSNPQIAAAGYAIPSLRLFGLQLGPEASVGGLDGDLPSPVFGWVVLAVVIACALLVCNLRRSHLGRELLAVRANERAASAIGINVRNVKLVGFTLSSTIAGIGGVLIAFSSGSILPTSYDTVTSLSLIAFAYIGGITTVQGAVIAGMLFTGNLVTICLQTWWGISPSYTTLVAGLLLIAVLVWIPDGLGGALFYGDKREKAIAWVRRIANLSPRQGHAPVATPPEGVAV